MQALRTFMQTRAFRIARRTLGITLGLVALIGFAHTPYGRPLLNALRGAPGCPIDLDGDPVKVEAFRVRHVQRGNEAARSHRALAFTLGATPRAEVEAYMQQHGARCESKAHARLLECTNVPDALSGHCGPRIENLQLQFDPNGTLVALDLFRSGTTGQDALALLAARERDLNHQVGPSTEQTGERNARTLDEHAFARTSTAYRYTGYVAELSAMSYGARGVRVREQYQWLPAMQLAAR